MQPAPHPTRTQRWSIRSISGVLIASIGAVAMVVGASATPAAGTADVQEVPLHNVDAPIGTECPDDVNDYWHFVIAPNDDQFSFVEITLDLDGTEFVFSGGDLVLNSGQADNVFVQVPAGRTADEVRQDGSSALISPSTGSPKFVLSHICSGTTATTTTTTSTPTTSTPTTSTTTSTTTTTTTTSTSTTSSTTSPTTTSTPDASTSTTSTPSSPPTSTATSVAQFAPPTTQSLASPTRILSQELPRTGSDHHWSLGLLGAALMLLGSIMLLGARRGPRVT